MLDPIEVLEREGQMMGRGVRKVNVSSMVSGPVEIMTLLYDCDPIQPRGVGKMYEQRVAVVVAEGGKVTNHTSLVAQTRFEAPEDGGQ